LPVRCHGLECEVSNFEDLPFALPVRGSRFKNFDVLHTVCRHEYYHSHIGHMEVDRYVC
jgi:hypothetical protein